MKQNTLFILAIVVSYGCKKTYDLPELDPVNESAVLQTYQLRDRCRQSNSYYRFGTGDTNLYGIVTMDEVSGNLYKQVFLLGDDGGAISLRLTNSGGLFAGDRIRINLNGCWLVSSSAMIYIDSLDIEKSVVKLSSGNKVNGKVATIEQISAITDPQNRNSLQSQLVELNGVEFEFSARGKTFANPVSKSALEYNLTDCKGNKITVRTSGMCNFAGKSIPGGNGKLIGVVQQYNNQMSLAIRNYNELSLNSAPCTLEPLDTSGTRYLYKNFDDKDLYSGGWLCANVTGTTSWACSNIGQSSYYGRIYNKNGSVYEACESWLISPPVDLSLALNPVLSFVTANSSTASPLSLMVSVSYQEGVPQNDDWTELPFAIQKNSFNYFKSGEIPLQAYLGPKIRIAFRYKGSASGGSIWDVDDILIKEKQ